jgi:hypothetical protein
VGAGVVVDADAKRFLGHGLVSWARSAGLKSYGRRQKKAKNEKRGSEAMGQENGMTCDATCGPRWLGWCGFGFSGETLFRKTKSNKNDTDLTPRCY